MRGRWGKVEEIFQAVMDLPPSRRHTFLDRQCSDDPELRRDVESLAVHAEGVDTFFDGRLNLSGNSSCSRIGQRLGPYRLDRQIGVGGMGTVYLATRDDGEYCHSVALKLVRADAASPWIIQRFYQERQALASLSHPNIARLYDGGSTPEGVPYLVMEYIDGQPITEYCRRRALSLDAKLKLFLGVCDAVSYAHRNLVVHRDIKPGNILVSADGVPKLLDFGISKLIDQPVGHRSETVTCDAARLMTPEYASPEQIQGGRVTTSTDVYSLGVVLYELLTGSRPHRTENPTPAEIERVICDSETPKPSAVAGHPVPGDLDNIVLMAMRKEPERRYAGVQHLAEDIRRYLAGRPVTARDDTFAYRAGKFIRRHQFGVSAAVLLAITMTAGVATTVWQTKRVAEQVFRAERRFVQFRKLANAFLFDFDKRIQNLKDISEARQLVVDTGIEYIDGLARETDGDPMLVRELARAYEKFGDVQGFRHEAGMGRAANALRSYQKAISLLDPLYQSSKADTEALLLLSRTTCSAGEMIERVSGTSIPAKQSYEACLQIGSRAAQGRMHQTRFAGLVVRAHGLLGDAELAAGNRTAALENYQSLLRMLANHESSLGRSGIVWLSDTKRRIGRWHATGGDHAAALRWFKEALFVARRATAPNLSPSTSREILAVYTDLVRHLNLSPMGYRISDAAAITQEMLKIAESLATAYPRHPLVLNDLRSARELEAAFRAANHTTASDHSLNGSSL